MSTLAQLKQSHFVLWRPRIVHPAPRLVIGTFRAGNPSTLDELAVRELEQDPAQPEIWSLRASDLNLPDGVYHYFFEVADSSPYKLDPMPIRCTDPHAWTVDWRLMAPSPGKDYGDGDRDPASVVMLRDGFLSPCDAGGEELPEEWDLVPPVHLPANNRIVVYELPTSWSRKGERNGIEIDVGSFRDVLALVDKDAEPANFVGSPALVGRSHIEELGVNAMEFLPLADSWVDRQWGYSTSNYLAADYDLGRPAGNTSSTATTDLGRLVSACHSRGIRVIVDMAMGFANHCPLENTNFLDFHVEETDNPAEIDPEKDSRENWGGQLFKYEYSVAGYDPVGGSQQPIHPARRYMLTQVEHWLRFYHIDGVRMDSIKTVRSWDFVRDFRDHARAVWRDRYRHASAAAAGADERFVVVAEVLDHEMEKGLVWDNRVDGVWNTKFMELMRYVVLGQKAPDEPSFEWTLRKAIDCRNVGFGDGAQVVNYLGSHDTEGYRNERLFDFLQNNGVIETQQRIQLGFACLLTAVGIPMILAGDEFAEHSDLQVKHPTKQMDAVNFDRVTEPWRNQLFKYVSRLVRLRTESLSLAVNDTEFIHVDTTPGRQVLAWRRGGTQDPVVVVANFSDWGTQDPGNPRAEYVVANWPRTPPGRRWREITQDRYVPSEWAGREPLFPWEAKIYRTEAIV
ncbi:alpha amylase [Opitutaceae bacterium EW11]|nr:alpha amylase [Opitutaceae bacterium EW11]